MCVPYRTKTNKKWNLQERQVAKTIVENCTKVGKYVGEKKERIALIFVDSTEERVSQSKSIYIDVHKGSCRFTYVWVSTSKYMKIV